MSNLGTINITIKLLESIKELKDLTVDFDPYDANSSNIKFDEYLKKLGKYLEITSKVIEEVKTELFLHDEMIANINNFLNAYLSPRETNVLQLRFQLIDDDKNDGTLEYVGKKHSVTRERIRQIEIKAMRKLRENLRGKLARKVLKGNYPEISNLTRFVSAISY